MADSISPFRVAVPEQTLYDLRERLRRTRWPDRTANPDGMYGAEVGELMELRDHWLNRFDWRQTEAALNNLPNYMWEYGEGRLHFLHVRGMGPDPLPLLFSHGWPGSILEALKLIPMLTDPARYGGDPGDSFDVIVPSLPGFGFSSAAAKPGMNTFAIAGLFAALMKELGYERFVAQGGDFGASIGTILALRHAERVLGVHLNYIPGSYRPYLSPADTLTEEESEHLASAAKWYEEQGAYAHVQRYEPQTLAAALNDSPMGLAAWIADKFERWADLGQGQPFTRDELLANITLYWVTQSIGSSCRLYVESRLAPLHFGPGDRVRVPCAMAHFPKELPFPPRSWIERGYEVTQWTEMPFGGHFAAMEAPELLARDLREFCRGLRTR